MSETSPAPLVSVVVPTKNRLDYLRETLASLVAQTHSCWEAIVVDDGSTDGTAASLRHDWKHDPRIQPIFRPDHRPEGGAQVCRNLGLSHARGDFVLFLDSDDLLSPDCLARRCAVLATDPTLDFVVGQCTQFDDAPSAGDPLWARWEPGQDDLDAFLGVGQIPWQTSGPLWRRQALARVGPWDERLVHAGHDHEFHVRALCRGLRHTKLTNVDYHWRRPRRDSLSSLDGFKQHHARGSMIDAYLAILASVATPSLLTARRAVLLRREAVKLAVHCRLNGGSVANAFRSVDAAGHAGLLSAANRAEIRLALVLWPLRLGGRIPSMAWLHRRYLPFA